MRFIMQAAINMAVFLACALLFPNGFILANMATAAGAAIVLAFLNRLIKPLLVFVSLPLVVLTLGFFILVINTILLEITAHLIHGFAFASFGWAMLVAILLTLANFIFTGQKEITIRR
ncbi:putative membrane protein [Fructobacillus pseudoficulneus]|uniref:Putative membrane protein n=1 Tax=Fructobacillus pseudoficulneus TaxID=220714 RepID=A0A3F3H811_9LACO|nr:phage holin family protein [Fructobacillus pseudoficulneus]GAP02799.1 putative membrane protein [Fructobacillus pseudoficulneus]SEH40003.1 putative membrane protein [Fructobacillus pseudoficulneus]